VLKLHHARLHLSLSVAWLALAASVVAKAQMPVADDGIVKDERAPALLESLPSETLGPDDLVVLSIPYCTELSHAFRVGTDGTLTLPLMSKKMQASGLTPDQLADEIKAEVKREQILNDPTVSVSVQEYRSRPVSVVGAVIHPVTFQATGRTTLLDAIARAGGLSPSAGGTIVLTQHAGNSGGLEKVQRIAVSDLLSGSDTKYNVILHGADEIRVPEASKIFVTGNVHRPGMYAMPADLDTTVLKAIALSEGLTSFSAKVAYIYRREPGQTNRVEVAVPLKSIMARKSSDVFLKPDDILYIPDAAGRRLTGQVLTQIMGFGSAAGTGLLIYR
jgi:polysaccharide export outer membrane protein